MPRCIARRRSGPAAPMAGSVDLGIDHVERPLLGQDPGDLLAAAARHLGYRRRREVGRVRGEDDVVEPPQRAVGAERLLLERVKRGAGEPALLERAREGGLVDDGAAGGVDQAGGGLHAPEEGLMSPRVSSFRSVWTET